MAVLAFGSLFLHPAVLCLIIWIVARKNAEFGFATVFFVALAFGLGSSFIILRFAETLGAFVVLPALAIGVFLLMRFCYTSLGQSVVILILFAIYQYAFHTAILDAFNVDTSWLQATGSS